MNDELPQGWAETTLQKAGAWRSGGTPSRRRLDFFGKGIPWVKSGDLQDGPILNTEEEITKLGLQNSSAKLMPSGTISMALYGATIGKLGVMTFPAATNQACANVIPDDRLVESNYLFYYLLSERRNFIEQGQGGAQPNISQEIVRTHPFRLAPLEEQRRIMTKLEKLLGQVGACQQRLAKIPPLLKRFRQAVLAAACSGRLTADWREKTSAKELPSSDDLPRGWSSSTVGDVLAGLKYGTAAKCGYERRGVPVLRIPNVVSGRIDDADLKFAELPAKELNKLRLISGDILVIRSNGSVSLVGRSAIVSEQQKDFGYAGYLIRLRSNRAKIEPEFLNLVLASYDVRLQIELQARSTSGVNNINSEEVQALHFLLPLRPEQKEIVRRVESLFALADRIETRFEEGQKRVNSIMQAILAKAFRGELVPTEAELAKAEGRTFESAEELLERIGRNGNLK